jgi:hypothetical protein
MLRENKIPFWVEVCTLSLSFDMKNKAMCEELSNLFYLNDERRRNLIDFFLRHVMTLISNYHMYNDNLKEFIRDEEKFLLNEISNITLMSKASTPSSSRMRTRLRDNKNQGTFSEYIHYFSSFIKLPTINKSNESEIGLDLGGIHTSCSSSNRDCLNVQDIPSDRSFHANSKQKFQNYFLSQDYFGKKFIIQSNQTRVFDAV